jgi:CRP-like cAMP-binding protein
VIAQLPPFIRHDLSWCLNKHFLEKVPMFMGADATSLMVINQFLTHVIITPGEFLLRSGEIGGAMFFVISGTLTVWDESVDGEQQEQVAELFEGSVVGEVGVLLNTPATYDVQAKTTCDLFQLTKDDFINICDVFPTFRDKLCHRAEVIYGPG